MKKKVLFVLPYWSKGGAEKQFRYICNEISKYHDVDILLLNFENDNIPGVKNIFYINNDLFVNKDKLIKFMLRLKSYIKIKFYINKKLSYYDSVIGHNKLLIPIMYMLKSKSNKVIFSAREADSDFTKGIIKIILSKLDMITCNSKVTYDLLKAVNHKIEYIGNGVEVNEYEKNDIATTIKSIGIIANISRRKNIKLVIESLKYLDSDIKVSIAGKIEDNEYYEEIKEYIRLNNLEKKVEFLNYVNNINEFYRNIDLIILPSLYEGTSNVILESFSRKKLILISDIPENNCLINKIYKEKIIFNPNDYKDLANKIINLNKLLEQKDKVIEEIIESNYKKIVDEYSIDVLKHKYLELI